MSEYDDDQNDSPDEARYRFRRRVSTEGLQVAYDTALALCRDPKAPAPAKATAVVALMRAAGAFERRKDDDDDTDIALMTAAQRQRRIAYLETYLKRRDPGYAAHVATGDAADITREVSDGGDVFG